MYQLNWRTCRSCDICGIQSWWQVRWCSLIGSWLHHSSLVRKKKNCCVARKWNFWIFGLGNQKIIYFLIIILKTTQKYQIWVHFLLFFPLKKKVGEKKTPKLSKIGCILDPNFLISFFVMGWSLRASQHFLFFFLWPKTNNKWCSQGLPGMGKLHSYRTGMRKTSEVKLRKD